MFRGLGTIAAVALMCGPAQADELKTTRIALFSSGVGYFESATTVEGTASAELEFRVDQINDVLKSLVLQDLDGGTVAAVQYPSRDPVEKALESFAVDITGRPTLGELLDQLRGVLVQVDTPKPVTGAIVGVEKETMLTPQRSTIEREILTILTDAGLRTFALREVAGVKILDPKVEGELRKALAALAASHDSEKKTVVLNFVGQGRRRVRAGYILETPIWKTSYRLVLGEKGAKPYLQGWAIVENTTEQDWEGVRLSLVSGRPISFAMDLYQPLYVPRPVEEMALYQSLRPPTYEGALVGLAKRPARKKGLIGTRRGRLGGLGGGRFIRGGKGMFAGGGGEEDEDEEDYDDEDSEEETYEEEAEYGAMFAGGGVASLASAKEAGELFEYVIQTPVSLKRRHAAMLPIVTTEIEGRKLSIYNEASHPKHPLGGLKITNRTGLHLMQGPVTVFDGGLYAGDAKLPDLRADEERLIAYALDLSIEVDVERDSQPDEVTRVWIAKGTIWQVRKLFDKRAYTLRNKDAAPRTVLVEQSIGSDWQLVEPKSFEEKTGRLTRFKVDLAAGETQRLVVQTERIWDESVALTRLDPDGVTVYLRERAISGPVKEALARLIELRGELDETVRRIRQLLGEVETITKEQKRIRENMEVLSDTSEVYRRYERKFDAQETQIEDLRRRIAELRDQEQTRRQELEEYIQSLEVQ